MTKQIVDHYAFAGTYPFGEPGDVSLEDVIRHMDELEIKASYVTDIDAIFQKNPMPANIRHIQKCEKISKRLLSVAVIDLSTGTFAKDIVECKKNGCCGIRIAPNYHGYTVSLETAKKLIAVLEKNNLVLFVSKHLEEPRFQHQCLGIKLLEIKQIKALFYQRRAKIVLNNFGVKEIESFLEIPEIKENSNVYFDVSGFDKSFYLMETYVRHEGDSRLVFGSNFPFFYKRAVIFNLENSFLDKMAIKRILFRRAK